MRALRLISIQGSDDDDLVECYHNRIQETVVHSLSAEHKRQIHERLVCILEETGLGDAQDLFRHSAGAGKKEKAGRYTLQAADEAFRGLAFARAVHLYQSAIEHASFEPAERTIIYGKLGDALANSGKGLEAAQSYLKAVESAPRAKAIEFQCAAAKHYMHVGHFDEGIQQLRKALAMVGLKLPRSSWSYPVTVLMRRAHLRRRGYGRLDKQNKLKPSKRVLERMVVCWAAGVGYAPADLLRQADFHTRYQLLALKTNDSEAIVRGLCAEIFMNTTTPSGRRRADKLHQIGKRLAEENEHPALRGLLDGTISVRWYMDSYFGKAYHKATQSAEVLRNHVGVYWEQNSAELIRLWSAYYLGRAAEIQSRLPILLAEAQAISDQFMLTTLCTSILNTYWLAQDDVQTAKQMCESAMQNWTHAHGIHLQHYWVFIALCQADLYQANGLCAWERVRQQWGALRRSTVMLLSPFAQTEALFLRGRVALAAAHSTNGKKSKRFLKLVHRTAAILRRKSPRWSACLAHMLEGGYHKAKGDDSQALQHWKNAQELLEKFQMADMLDCVCYRYGELLANEEGNLLMHQSIERLRREQIRSPEKYINMILPADTPLGSH